MGGWLNIKAQSQRYSEQDICLNVCFVWGVNCDFNPFRCVPPQKKKEDPLNVRWVIKQKEPHPCFTLIPHTHFLSLIWQIYTLLLPEYAALYIFHLAVNPILKTVEVVGPFLHGLLRTRYLRQQLNGLCRGKRWNSTSANSEGPFNF